MAINTSGILKTPQGSAIQNAEIIFEQTRTSAEVLAGTKFSVITNQTGNYSSSLGVGTYVFKVRFQDETQYRTIASNVIVTQSMNNYTLNQIIQDQSQLQDVDYDLLQAVIQARDQAAASAQAAQSSQATATTKASEASSSAQAALASKNAAQTSEANALSSKNAAQTSQTNAANSQTAAATSQTTATTKATEASNSAQAALTSKNAAQTSEANALASKNAAQTSQTTASTKASEAAASQTTATTKAGEAAASQTQAQQSQSDAQDSAEQSDVSQSYAQSSQTSATASQNTATTKASEASSSAQAALASKNAAQTSETNALASKNQAQTSQTNAANSQTAAAGSQTTATTKAGEASSQQTNAANSQTTATTKAGEASTSQTNAAASQTTATTKAGEASSSQTAAAGSQTTATTKATESANSATLAQKWAANPENSIVSGGLYSALHYAAKAAQSAQTASGQLVWRGGWSAQAGNAPPTPAGSTQDFYRITQAGTILSVQYEVGDYIHWDTINSIWFKMDGTDSVTSVNGRTGAVVVTKTDVGLSAVNNWGASSQTNDASTTTYATTAGVKAAYDLAATKLTATANAVSATKLVTARSINGTNFDGTANITTQNWGTSRNLTIGGTAKAVNGSADVSWTLAEIGAAPAGYGLGVTQIQKVAQDQTEGGFWRDAALNLAGITMPYDGSPSQAFLAVNVLSNTLRFGKRTGATSVAITWFDVYSTNNKPTAADLSVVPDTRTVNGKRLNQDIALTPDDLGAVSGRSETKDFTGGAGVWVRIARIRAPQSTSTFKFVFTGGSGFNSGSTVYTNKVEIVARAYNNNPKGLGLVAYRNFASGALFSDICSVNVSGDDYDIYVKSIGQFGQRCIAEYYVASGVLLDTTHIHETTTLPSQAVVGQIYDLYSTGFKPTAQDVGALPITGGTVTGALLTSVNDAMAIRARRAGYWAMMGCSNTAGEYVFGGGADNLTDYQHYIRIGNAKLQFQTQGSQWNIFHEGYVPTAATVGAMAASSGIVTTQDWNTLTVAGSYSVQNFTGANSPQVVGHPGVYTYGTLLVQNNSETISQMYITDGDRIYLRDKFRSNGWGTWKPVSSDETMAIDKSVDLDDFTMGGTFNMYKGSGVTFTNAPSGFSYGTLHVIGRGSTANQFVTQTLTQRGSLEQWVRTRSDGTGTWTAWNKIYNEAQKPTPADLGALATTGGDLSNRLRVIRNSIAGWPVNTANDQQNYINRAILTATVNNNGLHIFGNGDTNARRMGIQSGHSDAQYSTSYGILDLNPFGGQVRINGNDVYTAGNKPTQQDVGAVPTTQLLPASGYNGVINWADLVGKVPVINSGGLIELGRYIDMREQDANTDFNWRWDAGAAGANRLSLYNGGGSPVFEFNSTGRFNVPTNGGDINSRLKVYHGINPMYEWHIPGKYAVASYLTAANDWRFVSSDGAGGETVYRFVSFSDGRFINRGAVLTDHNTGSAWSEFHTAAFRVNNTRAITAGSYHKVISHRLYNAGHYDLENSLGAFADAAGWDMLCHTLVSTSGSAGVTCIWKFRNDGAMYTPSGAAFDKDGNSWGAVFGGSSLTYWAINRFAPISDVRYKKNMTECDGLALDVIDKFRFYAYDWDDSKKIVADKHHVKFGVSAQELELIDKAYVKESEVHEVMGEDPTTIKTLDDSNLLTLALKAIQELRAEIEELKKR